MLALFVAAQHDERLILLTAKFQWPFHASAIDSSEAPGIAVTMLQPLGSSTIFITLVSTAIVGIPFYYLHRHLLKILLDPLISDLSREFFSVGISEIPPTVTLSRSKTLLRGARRWRTIIAVTVALAYVAWAATIYFTLHGQVPFALAFAMSVVGVGMGRLHYLRLRIFNPIPLIISAESKGQSSHDAFERIFATMDREELEKYAKIPWEVALMRRISHLVFRISNIAVGAAPPSSLRRADENETASPQREAFNAYHASTAITYIVMMLVVSYVVGRIAVNASHAGNHWWPRLLGLGCAALTAFSLVTATMYRAAMRDARGCRGAPDWIIEVLSPSTAARDQIEKRRLYERHRVRAYWLAHPHDLLVTVYQLQDDGQFSPAEIRELRGTQPCALFDGLEVDWDQVTARLR